MFTSSPRFGVLAGTFISVWLMCIPAAELAFRAIGDEPSPDMGGLYVPFSRNSYRMRASFDTHAFFAAGKVSVHTDEFGLRCDEQRRLSANPKDRVDVLLMGDSQGFGNGVNYEETIAGSLARIGLERGYRVANASVGGHSLANQFALVRWLVDEGGVEVSNFVVLLTPPMINSAGQWKTAVVGNDGRLYGGDFDWRTRVTLWAKTHLVVYSRIRDAIRNVGIGAAPSEPEGVLHFYDSSQQHLESAEHALETELKKLLSFAEQRGAALHLVYVPLIVEADFSPVQSAARSRGKEVDPDIPLRISSAAARELSLPWHNLKPVLLDVHSQGHALNVKGDFHYSAELSEASGARLAGELDFVLKERETRTAIH